jgi:Glycosyl transferases group 1
VKATTASNGGAEEVWTAIRGRGIDHLVREDVPMSSAPISLGILRCLGFDVRLVTERELELAPDRLLFVAGNPRAYKGTLALLAATARGGRPTTIVWHTEPLPMPRAAGLRREPLTLRELAKVALRDRRINDHYSNARYLKALAGEGAIDVFAVATHAYQAYLAEQGVDVAFVPLGYHPAFGTLLERERDIDVLFLGDFRLRRRRRILRGLRREGIDVLTLGDYTDPSLWGEGRTELMNRTKIALNIPRLEGHLPDMRFVVAMATGALLVSEPVYLPDPYVAGRHYVECPTDDLADTIRRLLADTSPRRQITLEAHRFVTTELTLEGSYTRLLSLAAAAIARREQ